METEKKQKLTDQEVAEAIQRAGNIAEELRNLPLGKGTTVIDPITQEDIRVRPRRIAVNIRKHIWTSEGSRKKYIIQGPPLDPPCKECVFLSLRNASNLSTCCALWHSCNNVDRPDGMSVYFINNYELQDE